MSSTAREARKDAREYARARMFYGEGAGTRRHHIKETVKAKSAKSPIYERHFEQELARQDMAEHSRKATAERRRKDVSKSVKQNTKALATGNWQNAQAGVIVLATIGYVLHQTGMDKVILKYLQKLVARVRLEYNIWKTRRQMASVHNITTLKDKSKPD